MGPSALGNQHRSKLTVQTEITSKSVALVAFESSSLTAELKFESHWVGRVDEFVVTVRMVEIERLMGEIAGHHFRHLSSSVKFSHFMVMQDGTGKRRWAIR
jgi:hypothetical protein